MEYAINSGYVDVIGVARPNCGQCDCVAQLMRKEIDHLPSFETSLVLPWYGKFMQYFSFWRFLQFAGTGLLWNQNNLLRMSQGLDPEVDADVVGVMIKTQNHNNGKKSDLIQSFDPKLSLQQSSNTSNVLYAGAGLLLIWIFLAYRP